MLAGLVIAAVFAFSAGILAGIVLITERRSVARSTGELEGEDWPDFGDEPPTDHLTSA